MTEQFGTDNSPNNDRISGSTEQTLEAEYGAVTVNDGSLFCSVHRKT